MQSLPNKTYSLNWVKLPRIWPFVCFSKGGKQWRSVRWSIILKVCEKRVEEHQMLIKSRFANDEVDEGEEIFTFRDSIPTPAQSTYRPCFQQSSHKRAIQPRDLGLHFKLKGFTKILIKHKHPYECFIF